MENITEREKGYLQNSDQFYRGQVFGMIETRLDRIEKDSKEAHENLAAKIDELQGQMKYIFGFAAAVGVASTFVWDWIKKKL